MRIPVEVVCRGYIEVPADSISKGFETAKKFLKKTSRNIKVDNLSIVYGTAKVLTDTCLLYREDICDIWNREHTENVLIFKVEKEQILIMAAIEELNEKLTLIEFGFDGWELSEEDFKEIQTAGVFTVLDRMRSVNGPTYATDTVDNTLQQNLFLNTAVKYGAEPSEVMDGDKLCDYLKVNQQFNKNCLSENGGCFMLKIIKKEE